jgi:hypothetical protein
VCWSRLRTLQVLVLGLDARRGPAQRHLHPPRARGVGGPRGLPGALPGERARCGRDRKVREGAQCCTMSERGTLVWPCPALPCAIKALCYQALYRCDPHLHGGHGAVAEGHGALARVHLPQVQVRSKRRGTVRYGTVRCDTMSERGNEDEQHTRVKGVHGGGGGTHLLERGLVAAGPAGLLRGARLARLRTPRKRARMNHQRGSGLIGTRWGEAPARVV